MAEMYRVESSILLIFSCGILWGYTSSDNSYNYNYVIDTGEIVTQHSEEGHQDKVRGFYSFLQPDGRIRGVQYEVDKWSGFRAFVRYRRLISGTLMGHLRYPKDFKDPVILATPVSLITRELFQSEDMSSNCTP